MTHKPDAEWMLSAADSDKVKMPVMATVEQQMEMLDTVAANTEASLVYLDRDFDFVWVNSTYAIKCSRSRESFIGHNHFDIYPHAENESIFRQVRDTGKPFRAKEKPFVFPDHAEWGVTYWNWTLVPMLNAEGVTQGLVFSLVDVTEDVRARQETERLKEEAEQAREAAERRAAELESFVSSIADGVTLFDTEGRIVMMNEAGKDILGGLPGPSLHEWTQMLRTYDKKKDPISLEDTASYQALKGKTYRDARHYMTTVSGDEIVLSVSASPVMDGQSRIIGATNVFRDITEWVDFEQRREELYRREHHIAEVLQQAVVPPQTRYDIEGVNIAVKYQPALNEAEIGGDFYDIFELGEGQIGILIGDVVGKGLAAAIRVAAARYSVRSNAYLDPSPARALELSNRALCRDHGNSAGMLTAFFAVLDVRDGVMRYANGGHEPPVLCDSEGKCEELLAGGGALGVFEHFSYAESRRSLKPCDTVVMITDGITEARRSHSQLFSKRRVYEFLTQNREVSAESIAFGLLEAARMHAGGHLQDDAAIVVFRLNCEDAKGV